MVSGPMAIRAPSTTTSWTYRRPTKRAAGAGSCGRAVSRAGSARDVMNAVLLSEGTGLTTLWPDRDHGPDGQRPQGRVSDWQEPLLEGFHSPTTPEFLDQ